ncbi:MFS transporter [Propionicicella superfundia]|uniref:MFS transporter n=1 Tax=Propionicicella superfundia TaxID=348582 RepID=UPI0004013084|nr:MFS transporter [Propionicicella superfundia]
MAQGVSHDGGTTLRGARAGLLSLSASAFAAVTTEMVPVGLLPQIGAGFGVGESTTGLLVSLYAVMVAVLSVPLTFLTRHVRRKPLLLLTLGSYLLSNLIVVLAPSLLVVGIGRALGGATHALFFSVCIGYAARLVPPSLTGRAMALSSAGGSAGFILGVPLTTALGNAAGWRTAFVALVVLLAVVLVLVVLVLPSVEAPVEHRSAYTGHLRQFVAVVGANGLTFLGQYVLYTFVSVVLLRSGAAPEWVGPVLLVFGVCGLIGLAIAGPRLDLHTRASALVMTGTLVLGIVGVGIAYPVLAGVVVAGAVWAMAFGPIPSLYQTVAVRTRATSPEIAGAWINGTANLGIAVGAAIGGRVLVLTGVEGLAWVAAVLMASAALLILLARRAFPKAPFSREP